MLEFKDGTYPGGEPVRFCNVKVKFQLTRDVMVNAVCRMLMEKAEWDGDSVSNIDDLRSTITKTGIDVFIRNELHTSGINRFWYDIFDQFIDEDSQKQVTKIAESICSDFYGL